MPLYNNLVKVPGTNNVTVGKRAGPKITTGADNIVYGENAGALLTTGSRNTFLGRNTGSAAAGLINNVFVGAQAGSAYTSTLNASIGIGYQSLLVSTTGPNTAIGHQAGSTITTGGNNTLIGHLSSLSPVTLSNCIALGFNAQAQQTQEFAVSPNMNFLTLYGTTPSTRPRVTFEADWVDSADATRTSRLIVSTYHIATAQEGFRVESDSSGSFGARLGFYGATAVAQQTITGSKGGNVALANLLTALATLGFLIDSTT